jgi:hypothetical protein
MQFGFLLPLFDIDGDRGQPIHGTLVWLKPQIPQSLQTLRGLGFPRANLYFATETWVGPTRICRLGPSCWMSSFKMVVA